MFTLDHVEMRAGSLGEGSSPRDLPIMQEQPKPASPEDDLRLWRVIKVVGGLGIASFLVIIVCAAHDRSPPTANESDPRSPIGWLGAAGAALFFGTVWVPYGLQSAEQSDPNIRPWFMIAYGSLGTSVTTGIASWLLVQMGLTEGSFSMPNIVCGFFGAMIVGAANFLSYLASRWVGVAVSPVLLASSASVTSFLLGMAFFSEPIEDVFTSACGLVLLILGAATCAVARTELPKAPWCGESHAALLKPSCSGARSAVPCRTRVFFVLGCIIAVVAGFVDGSMLVPYKVYQLRSIDASNMQDQTFAAQEAVNSTTDISEVLEPVRKSIAVPIKRIRKGVHSVVGPVVNATKPLQKSIKETVKPAAHAMSLKVQHTNASYSYLQGMSAAQFAISAVLVLVLRLVEACDPEGLVEQTRQACSLPGFLGGVFWAFGNISSIHASEYLGMAVGFPLTQCNVAVAAVYAAVLFDELPHYVQRVFCAAGIAQCLIGSALLAIYA